jgi:hypothetical protein
VQWLARRRLERPARERRGHCQRHSCCPSCWVLEKGRKELAGVASLLHRRCRLRQRLRLCRCVRVRLCMCACVSCVVCRAAGPVHLHVSSHCAADVTSHHLLDKSGAPVTSSPTTQKILMRAKIETCFCLVSAILPVTFGRVCWACWVRAARVQPCVGCLWAT